MKIVVIGGTGRIGSRLVTHLTERGHQAVAASPSSGVNTITGDGLGEAFDGASVVVDVTGPPPDADPLQFFRISTLNQQAAETGAGVKHHVALSIVGTERLAASEYFRARLAQEGLIKASTVPFTIVHATQFFEFIPSIADEATDGATIRLAHVLFQPVAADDVATAVALVAEGEPVNGVVEFAGPEVFHLDTFIRQVLTARNDPRKVLTDSGAPYFGAVPNERSLVPIGAATLAETRFDDWLRQTTAEEEPARASMQRAQLLAQAADDKSARHCEIRRS